MRVVDAWPHLYSDNVSVEPWEQGPSVRRRGLVRANATSVAVAGVFFWIGAVNNGEIPKINDWDIRMLEWDMLFSFLFSALPSCFHSKFMFKARKNQSYLFTTKRQYICPPTHPIYTPYYHDNYPTTHANTDPIFVYVFWAIFQQVSPYKTRYLRIQDDTGIAYSAVWSQFNCQHDC